MGTVITVIVIALVVIAAAAALFAYQRRKSGQLQERFGPEYERTIEQSGDRRSAERDLRQREQRRDKLDVHPLTGESAERYRTEWLTLQQSFVDAPADAVEQADQLVLRMMREAGYPVDDFDQRADDISVDHPDVAQNYRQAHAVAVAQSRGEADTEDLRQAVTAYRRLVEVLLDDDGRSLNGRHHTGPREQS
jgi:type II secretory pathway pseudopilin PulG